MITYLVIANATTAMIYEVTHHIQKQEKPIFQLLKTLSHPESRLKTSELVSDRPGSLNTTPHDHEQDVFAHEVAHFLDAARAKNQFQQLILCAGPHFHSLLNKALSKQTEALVKKHLQKDYVPLPQKELQEVVERIYKECQ